MHADFAALEARVLPLSTCAAVKAGMHAALRISKSKLLKDITKVADALLPCSAGLLLHPNPLADLHMPQVAYQPWYVCKPDALSVAKPG